MTLSEARWLADAWLSTREDAWNAARNAAWVSIHSAARDATWYTAWFAVDAAGDWEASWDDTGIAALDIMGAIMGAVLALMVKDLITQEQYDTLTGPVRRVLGKIHSADKELES